MTGGVKREPGVTCLLSGGRFDGLRRGIVGGSMRDDIFVDHGENRERYVFSHTVASDSRAELMGVYLHAGTVPARVAT